MNDYKLVPVEPTPKMLQVWKSMYGYSRYDKYKAMLAAAPVVQGEPQPDVSRLVEALERISKWASEAECRQAPCSPIQRLFVDIMQQADDALAAHRKGGES